MIITIPASGHLTEKRSSHGTDTEADIYTDLAAESSKSVIMKKGSKGRT